MGMIDKTGDWIETYTGKRVNAFVPEESSICIDDIAHALSQTCRFNGHTKKFISVAQHSLLVCRLIIDMYDELRGSDQLFGIPMPGVVGVVRPPGIDLNVVLIHGLCHDFSEAYLNDIPKPFKKSMPEYMAIEKKLTQNINVFLGLPETTAFENTMVHYADTLSCLIEASLFVDSKLTGWTYPDIFANVWRDYALNYAAWKGWGFSMADSEHKLKAMFLSYFETGGNFPRNLCE